MSGSLSREERIAHQWKFYDIYHRLKDIYSSQMVGIGMLNRSPAEKAQIKKAWLCKFFKEESFIIVEMGRSFRSLGLESEYN